jgi:RHS repeat-associated protein
VRFRRAAVSALIATMIGATAPPVPAETVDAVNTSTSTPASSTSSSSTTSSTPSISSGVGVELSVTGGLVSMLGRNAFGDVVSGPVGVVATSGVFGPTGQTDVRQFEPRVGYRGELHVGERVFLRARDLDPVLGRFTSTDPRSATPGVAGEVTSYAYANNDPVDNGDPSGMKVHDAWVNLKDAVDRSMNHDYDPASGCRRTNMGDVVWTYTASHLYSLAGLPISSCMAQRGHSSIYLRSIMWFRRRSLCWLWRLRCL